jgi:KDO2-lipid IV(A) lauroyltransferase
MLDFMGTPAHTHTAPQALAVRFQAPLVAGFCHRVGKEFKYRGYFESPALPDPEADPESEVLRLARYANDAIARFVRQHPEQWLWMHRRWR